MAIRQKAKQKSIEEIVSSGGSSVKEHRTENGQTDKQDIKRITLRLFMDFAERIDTLRAGRRGSRRVSLNAWILEAIEEKLERDERRANS